MRSPETLQDYTMRPDISVSHGIPKAAHGTHLQVPLPGGGATSLLFLLVAADKADALFQQAELTSDRRVVISEAADQINELLLLLVNQVEPGERLLALQEDLVRVHPPSVWRDFGAAAFAGGPAAAAAEL